MPHFMAICSTVIEAMTNLANFNFLVVLDTSEEDESDLDMNVEMTFLLGLKW